MLVIDDEILSNVVRTARYFIRARTPQGAPVPLETLDWAVKKASSQLLEDATAEEQELYSTEAARTISDGLRIQIADEEMLVGGPHIDWYFGDRRRTRPLWDRFKRFLDHRRELSDTTIASVDRCSDRILEQLGDPQSEGPFDRRGLVVGQVQSGKTTSYSAMINKAVDAGYQVIVILTGVHDSLRVQTQKRVEESVRGIATESGKKAGPRKGERLPLAEIGDVADVPHLFTTRAKDGDFNKDARGFANPVPGTHMFVVKKNVKILGELAKQFDDDAYMKHVNTSTGRTEIVGRALLIVDDESDNASVDGNRPDPTDRDHDPTAINKAIRSLLMRFRQRAYVGYTATPYANILIHKDNETAVHGPDLFPEHFIVMLPTPSDYVGPPAIFGSGTVEGGGGSPPPLLRYVEDCGTRAPDDWMPRGHNKSHMPRRQGGGIPESLEKAIMSFVLAATVRRLRGRAKAHNSMLIHVSRFKAVQVLVRDAVETFVYLLKGALADEAGSPEIIQRFEKLYEEDFRVTASRMEEHERGMLPPFVEVKREAREFLDLLKAWTVNSESADALDYDQFPGGLNVICVGGDKLSRGLTLEGLSVSYFLRASRMHDTLMQMGRWFGYRHGYKDLCRLYLTRDLASWYGHVARADEELRGEFATMQAENLAPKDFGLRVRSHPSLLVTAPAKMSSAQEFKLNFGGRVSQTIHFFRSQSELDQNAACVEALLGKIADRKAPPEALVRRDPKDGTPERNSVLPGHLYTDVRVEEIEAFIRDFSFHPEARSVSAPQLLEFIRRMRAARVETRWSVVVASGGKVEDGGASAITVAAGVTVRPVERAVKPPGAIEAAWSAAAGKDTITIGVLASPTDLIADFGDEEVKRLAALPPGRPRVDEAEAEHAARSRACKARDEDHCLLVIYVVKPTAPSAEAGSKNVAIQLAPGSKMPTGLAIALPANKNMPSVTYVVNSVVIDELEQQIEAAEREEGERP